MTYTIGERVIYSPPDHTPHRVTEPYERWGSGYACVPCIERFTGVTGGLWVMRG